MKRLLRTLLILSLCGIVVWWLSNQTTLLAFLLRGYHQLTYQPCQQPITYRIGALDPRFHLSTPQALMALKRAEQIWETPTGRDLFLYSPTGDVVVDLLYDHRQANTDKLKTLGIAVDGSRESYDALNAKYRSLKATYTKNKQVFDSLNSQLQTMQDQYDHDLAIWNAGDRRSRTTYDHLKQIESTLTALRAKTLTAQKTLNNSVATFNSVVDVLNTLATHLNLAVAQYNTLGAQQDQEFNEGLYESSEQGQRITIYEFQNQLQLTRVLAHELGHALGLDHSDAPADIMYRLNESKNEKLTANDIAAVNKVCQP